MEHRDEYIMDFTIKEEFDIKQEREDIEGNLGIIDVDQIFKPVSINGEFPDDQTTRNSYIKTESSEEEWQEDCISTCSYDEIKLEPYTIDLKHNSNTEFEPFIDRNLKHNPKTSEVEKKLKVKNRPSAQWKSETCSICGEIFVRRTTFERHLIRHGATQSPFECDVCGVKCKLMKHLIAHIARMHAIPNVRVACNDCGKYYHRDYLATHMSRHTTQHSKPSLECTICGKFFHIRANLTSHKRTHRKKKGQCPVCLKWFNVPDALRVHERVHTGEKPFLCWICGSRFRSKNTFDTHFTVHWTGKNFPCKFCDAKFKNPNCLDSHRRKVHARKVVKAKPIRPSPKKIEVPAPIKKQQKLVRKT